jgi:hypothetical protein
MAYGALPLLEMTLRAIDEELSRAELDRKWTYTHIAISREMIRELLHKEEGEEK